LSPTRNEHLGAVLWRSRGLRACRYAGGGQCLEIGIMGSDFGSSVSQRELLPVSTFRRSLTERIAPAGQPSGDQRHLTDDTVERLAQGGWRVDDDGLECDHGLCSALHAVSRATFRCRIISTSYRLIRPRICLTAKNGACALSASSGSLLPF